LSHLGSVASWTDHTGSSDVETGRQNQKRWEQEIEAAFQVQQRLFPSTLPSIPGFDYAGVCRPASGVSGDYYDFLALPAGRLGLLLADVSGKGMPAALLAASLQAAIRAYAPAAGRNSGEVLARINRLLFETTSAERFVTLFYGVYDSADRSFTWSNAGHNPPLWIGGASTCTRLDSLTPPAGMMSEIPTVQRDIKIEAGDRLCLFTDGIAEACLPGNIRLSRADTQLHKASVANVYDVQKVLRPDFLERVGLLPNERLEAIGEGLRLVLDL
jgi:sigma-B regulation protein RsbU (phosphoserine phosphatase)